MTHLPVQQAQEPLPFASISCVTQHVPQPVFFFGMALLQKN